MKSIQNQSPFEVQSYQNKMKKYQVLELLGRGASAIVYKAHNNQTNLNVAIKQVSLKSPVKQHEVFILQSIKHPNIIQCFQHFQDLKHQYLILQLCEMKDLQYYIDTIKNPFPQQIVKGIVHFINKGLSILSQNRVCHRDLKPANILLNNQFALKIADFGYAKIEVGEADLMESTLGTPLFMSPELLLDQQGYTMRVDIWGLGIIMFILLFGKHPFYNMGGGINELERNMRESIDLESLEMSPEARELLSNCLCNDSGRYTAQDVANSKFLSDVVPNQAQYQKRIASYLSQYAPKPSSDTNKQIAYLIQQSLSMYTSTALKPPIANLPFLSHLHSSLMDSFNSITHISLVINNSKQPIQIPLVKPSNLTTATPLERKLQEDKACLEIIQRKKRREPIDPEVIEVIDRVMMAPKELRLVLDIEKGKESEVSIPDIVGHLANLIPEVNTKFKAEFVYVSSEDSLLVRRLGLIKQILAT